MAENLEKVRSTEHHGAPLEGSTIFFCRSSTCRMSMESYRLADLKYAIFSMIGQKIQNYSSYNFWAENLEKFHSTEHYGAPLEGSTIFLCRSSLGYTSMESCQLADLK